MRKVSSFDQASQRTRSGFINVSKSEIMMAIQKWEQNHVDKSNIDLLDRESCSLRRLLSSYISEDMINSVAQRYNVLYINAVKEYMNKNGLKSVEDLLAFFGDKSYGAEFFPDFISFISNYIMGAVSIAQRPKIQFVKSGEKFIKYVKNPYNEDLSYLDDDKMIAFYDRDENTIFFKEDKLTNFDNFMTQLSHEISHAIDNLDVSKGVFQDTVVYNCCRKLYVTNSSENKFNAEEKSATRIGIVIGKNFTKRLSESLHQENINKYIVSNQPVR